MEREGKTGEKDIQREQKIIILRSLFCAGERLFVSILDFR